MNEIIIIKLISGEELLGTVNYRTPESIEMKNIVTIAYHPVGEGKMSAGFAPHMPYADGPIIVRTAAIAIEATVKEDMANEYKRIFGGIITPRQSIIT